MENPIFDEDIINSNQPILIDNRYRNNEMPLTLLYRGIMFKPGNQTFWANSIKCFKSMPLIDYNKNEEWFTINHNHDQGAV